MKNEKWHYDEDTNSIYNVKGQFAFKGAEDLGKSIDHELCHQIVDEHNEKWEKTELETASDLNEKLCQEVELYKIKLREAQEERDKRQGEPCQCRCNSARVEHLERQLEKIRTKAKNSDWKCDGQKILRPNEIIIYHAYSNENATFCCNDHNADMHEIASLANENQ